MMGDVSSLFKVLIVLVAFCIGIGCESKHIFTKDTHVDHHASPKYKFAYGVEDYKTGDYKTQEEERAGDKVKGVYTVAEPDGSLRTIRYTVDKTGGFKATVSKNRPHAKLSQPRKSYMYQEQEYQHRENHKQKYHDYNIQESRAEKAHKERKIHESNGEHDENDYNIPANLNYYKHSKAKSQLYNQKSEEHGYNEHSSYNESFDVPPSKYYQLQPIENQYKESNARINQYKPERDSFQNHQESPGYSNEHQNPAAFVSNYQPTILHTKHSVNSKQNFIRQEDLYPRYVGTNADASQIGDSENKEPTYNRNNQHFVNYLDHNNVVKTEFYNGDATLRKYQTITNPVDSAVQFVNKGQPLGKDSGDEDKHYPYKSGYHKGVVVNYNSNDESESFEKYTNNENDKRNILKQYYNTNQGNSNEDNDGSLKDQNEHETQTKVIKPGHSEFVQYNVFPQATKNPQENWRSESVKSKPLRTQSIYHNPEETQRYQNTPHAKLKQQEIFDNAKLQQQTNYEKPKPLYNFAKEPTSEKYQIDSTLHSSQQTQSFQQPKAQALIQTYNDFKPLTTESTPYKQFINNDIHALRSQRLQALRDEETRPAVETIQNYKQSNIEKLQNPYSIREEVNSYNTFQPSNFGSTASAGVETQKPDLFGAQKYNKFQYYPYTADQSLRIAGSIPKNVQISNNDKYHENPHKEYSENQQVKANHLVEKEVGNEREQFEQNAYRSFPTQESKGEDITETRGYPQSQNPSQVPKKKPQYAKSYLYNEQEFNHRPTKVEIRYNGEDNQQLNSQYSSSFEARPNPIYFRQQVKPKENTYRNAKPAEQPDLHQYNEDSQPIANYKPSVDNSLLQKYPQDETNLSNYKLHIETDNLYTQSDTKLNGFGKKVIGQKYKITQTFHGMPSGRDESDLGDVRQAKHLNYLNPEKAKHFNYHNSGESKHFNYQNSDESKHFNYQNSGESKHLNYQNSDERKHLNYQNLDGSKHLNYQNSDESKHLNYQNSDESKQFNYQNSDGSKHFNYQNSGESKHLNYQNSDETKHFNYQNSDESKHFHYQNSDKPEDYHKSIRGNLHQNANGFQQVDTNVAQSGIPQFVRNDLQYLKDNMHPLPQSTQEFLMYPHQTEIASHSLATPEPTQWYIKNVAPKTTLYPLNIQPSHWHQRNYSSLNHVGQVGSGKYDEDTKEASSTNYDRENKEDYNRGRFRYTNEGNEGRELSTKLINIANKQAGETVGYFNLMGSGNAMKPSHQYNSDNSERYKGASTLLQKVPDAFYNHLEPTRYQKPQKLSLIKLEQVPIQKDELPNTYQGSSIISFSSPMSSYESVIGPVKSMSFLRGAANNKNEGDYYKQERFGKQVQDSVDPFNYQPGRNDEEVNYKHRRASPEVEYKKEASFRGPSDKVPTNFNPLHVAYNTEDADSRRPAEYKVVHYGNTQQKNVPVYQHAAPPNYEHIFDVKNLP